MSFLFSRRAALLGLGASAGGLAAPALLNHRAWASAPPLNILPELDISEGLGARLVASPSGSDHGSGAGNLLGYNGTVPGPILRMREGRTAEFDFENATDLVSNLHFHGLHVDPTGTGDNPFLTVPPGDRQRYRFDVGRGNAGLHWYHPHVHSSMGSSAFAQRRGLVGAIVIDPEDGPDPLEEFESAVLVLQDFRLRDGLVEAPALNDWAMGAEGPVLTVNGQIRPVLEPSGRWIRLRIVNTSNARYWRLATSDDRVLMVTALDGHLLEQPQAAKAVTILPGGRSDIMIRCDEGNGFDILDTGVDRMASYSKRPQPVLHIASAPRSGPLVLPRRLTTYPAEFDWAGATRRDVPVALMTICNNPYTPGEPVFRIPVDSHELWTLTNWDLMDHPVHLHTWAFEPLARNGQRLPVRSRRDTINIRPGDRLEIGIRFDRFRGPNLFHCHIVEHADKGMMLAIEIT